MNLFANHYHLKESAYISKNSIKTAHKKLFKISNNFSKIKMSFNAIGAIVYRFTEYNNIINVIKNFKKF